MVLYGNEIETQQPVCPKCGSDNIEMKFDNFGHAIFQCECGEKITYSFSNIENVIEYLPDFKKIYESKKQSLEEYQTLLEKKECLIQEIQDLETQINEQFSKLAVGKCFYGHNRYIKVLKISSNSHLYNVYNESYAASLWCMIIYTGQKPSDNNIVHYGYLESIYLARYCEEVTNDKFESAVQQAFKKVLERSRKIK